MKNIGIIAEYNPFHNGHLYQINKIKEKFPDSTITVIMSPYFVQRGEPSILDKFVRAEIALENNVDLVLELPTIYSLQSAENFGRGSVKILNSLKYLDYLSFGVEAENFDKINEYVDIQLDNAKELSKYTLEYLNKGYSFANAKNKSTEKIYSDLNKGFDFDLIKSNNILAIEYLKALKKENSDIDCLPILRNKSDHSDENINYNNISSATSIRKYVKTNSKLNLISSVIPDKTYYYLNSINESNSINDYLEILKYKLIINKDSMKDITGYENGLDNLIIKNLNNSLSVEELINKSKNKRYSQTRIQRLIINYLLKIDNSLIDKSINNKNEYIRVLGFNTNGQNLLNKVKNNTDLTIITNFKQKNKLKNNRLLDIELDASNLYNIKKENINIEFNKNPIIKK